MKDLRRTALRQHSIRMGIARPLALFTLLLLPAGAALGVPQEANQHAYSSPDEAVAALVAAVKANDRVAVTSVVGSALDQLASGDEVHDNLALLTFAKRRLTKVSIVKTDDTTAVLYTGDENALFRLPLRKGARGWYFDVDAGKKQILDQRIGQNERRALDLLRLYVKAQKEYAAEDRDGDAVLEYAPRFMSSPGTRDGLYWPTSDMTPESPFGPLASLAKAQGYRKRGARPQPFQGYYFRVLVRQGLSAPGGVKEYVVTNGNMTEGFGCVAYPARWGVSGIMTFIVGPDGRVFEKNIGKPTVMFASAMTEFNPDETWTEVKR